MLSQEWVAIRTICVKDPGVHTDWDLFCGVLKQYRSLAKKGPVPNIRLPPIITSISRKGLKFTPKSAHPIDPSRVERFQKQHDARLVYSYTEYNI